jgi:hypothetical protein
MTRLNSLISRTYSNVFFWRSPGYGKTRIATVSFTTYYFNVTEAEEIMTSTSSSSRSSRTTTPTSVSSTPVFTTPIPISTSPASTSSDLPSQHRCESPVDSARELSRVW